MNEFYVVTAAHCVKGLENNVAVASVVIGIKDLDRAEDTNRYCISKIITHENYSAVREHDEMGRVIGDDVKNDIAVVKLDRRIDLSDRTKAHTVELSEIDLSKPDVDLNMELLFAG